MIYPAFFPCPTWQFSEAQTAFANRIPMESGWTRQRRRWADLYTGFDLSFRMSTQDFARWSDWVQANGYDWFTIKLDRVAGEKQEYTIRLNSAVSWGYDSFDIISANVTAEVSNVKENPPPIPPFNPGLFPECRPYSCSSYSDYLAEDAAENDYHYFQKNYLTADGGDSSNLNYPFCETATRWADGKAVLFRDFTNSPTPVNGYSGNSPNSQFIARDSVSSIDGPNFCGGETTYIAAIDKNNTSSENTCVLWPITQYVGEDRAYGDHFIEMLIMGHNQGNTVSGTLIRQTGKNWNYTLAGST